jgi:uncharacterized protein YgiM (DUF1202 family)
MNIEKKIFDFTAWFMAGLVLLILLTSCSPLARYEDPLTATPSATATLTKPNNSATPSPITCTIATGYERGTVNMRAGAGMSYAVKQILTQGEAVTILERGDWLKIETAQRVTGWVYGKYCK